MTREDLTEKATARILEERVHPFDLADGPLIRAEAVTFDGQEKSSA